MPAEDHLYNYNPHGVPAARIHQVDWLLDAPEELHHALRALACEPLHTVERERLVRLFDTLGTAPRVPRDAAATAALISQLTSDKFTWLPALPSPRAEQSESTESVHEATWGITEQGLVAVTRAISVPLRHGNQLALIYPLIVLILSLVILLGILLILIPPFESMFDGFGITLPPLTIAVITVSRWLRSGPAVLAALLLGIAIVAIMGRLLWPRISSRLRTAGIYRRGSATELIAMSRFIRAVAEMLAAGVILPDAIRSAAAHSGHPVLHHASSALAADATQDPASLARSPASEYFPANLIAALSGTAHPSNGLNLGPPNLPLLWTLAELYEERAEGRAQAGASVFGIFVVLALGAIVVITIMALFMPLISLATGLA